MTVPADAVLLTAGRERRPRGCGCLVGAFLFGLVMVMPFVAVLTVVWPGVLKLTAPVVCPEGFTDTVVARDTYSVRPGETSTTFTMYCLNERGELSEQGALKPSAIVFAVLAGAYVLVAVLLLAVGTRKARRRARTAGDQVTVPGMLGDVHGVERAAGGPMAPPPGPFPGPPPAPPGMPPRPGPPPPPTSTPLG